MCIILGNDQTCIVLGKDIRSHRYEIEEREATAAELRYEIECGRKKHTKSESTLDDIQVVLGHQKHFTGDKASEK
jgi:hypothetical protein